MASQQDKLRKHKDEAVRQLAMGRVKEALEELLNVQKLDPQDLANRQKIGDLWRKLGNDTKAIEAYQSVAGAYAADGLLLKAIAVCKLILQVDPNHKETQRTLADLYGKKRGDADLAMLPASMSAAVQPPPLPSGKRPASTIRGIPITKIPLKTAPGPAPLPGVDAPPRAPVEAAPPGPRPITLPQIEMVPLPDADEEMELERFGDGASRQPTLVPGEEPETAPIPAVQGVPLDIHEAPTEPLPVVSGMAVDMPGPAASWSVPPSPPVEHGPPSLEDIEMPPELAEHVRPPVSEADGVETDFGGLLDDTPATPAKVDLTKLPPIPLFNDLSKNAFIELMERMEIHSAPAGSAIVKEGDQGDSFFIIISGSVRVLKEQGGKQVELAVLSDGTFFGEMALLSDAPRTASVVAATDCELFEISRTTLDAVTESYPSVKQVMNNFYKQRLLSNLLQISPIFAPFNKEEQRELIGLFKSREVQPGDAILTEGQKGDGLYVVLSGRCSVVKEVGKGRKELARLKEGDIFGEMSLVTMAPVSASVVAATRVLVLRLPRKQFNEVIMTHPQVLELVSELTAKRQASNEKIAEVRAGAGAGLL